MEGFGALIEIKKPCYLKELFSQNSTLRILILMAFLDTVACMDEDSARAGDSAELLSSLVFSKTFCNKM